MSEEEKNIRTIESEKVIDMLPHVVDIYEKLKFDEFRKDLKKKYAPKKKYDYLDPVIDSGKYILRNAPKVKDEVFTIVSIVEDRPLEDVKKQSFFKTLNTCKEIFQDKDLMDFFKGAM